MEISPDSYARISSQKSNAVAPKRRRGHDRVALILDAAGKLFSEKGVDGTTMTEIAAQSGTAIGSLYRFFPTKMSLEVTLLERFLHGRLAQLDAICRQVLPGAYEETASKLLDVWLDRKGERDFTMLLLAARPDAEQLTLEWRRQFLRRVVEILEAVAPDQISTAATRGTVLLHILKLGPLLVQEESAEAIRGVIFGVVYSLVRGDAGTSSLK